MDGWLVRLRLGDANGHMTGLSYECSLGGVACRLAYRAGHRCIALIIPRPNTTSWTTQRINWYGRRTETAPIADRDLKNPRFEWHLPTTTPTNLEKAVWAYQQRIVDIQRVVIESKLDI